MIGKFLSDTLDAILDGLAALGLLRGGSVWFRQRMARRREQVAQERENTRRAIAADHRMCRECRALVPVSESTCTSCGASMRGIPKGGLSRALSVLLPGVESVSLTYVMVIVVIYFATAVFSEGGSLWQPPSQILIVLGWMWSPLIFDGGEWWRLVNPIFLHGGLFHIAMNGYALANLGPFVEAQIGARRFTVVFMLTGIVSFIVSAWAKYHPDPRFSSPSVGASGALFGLIGFGITHGYVHSRGMRAVSDQLVRWAIFGLLMIFIPMRIDHWAHGGGFVAGAILGVMIGSRVTRSRPADLAWTILAWGLGLFLPLLAFAMAIWTAYLQMGQTN